MNNVIFITSYKSPNKCKTLDLLNQLNNTHDYFIVIGDDDTFIGDYISKYKGHLLIFNKDNYVKSSDRYTNDLTKCSALYVKNYIEDYCEENNIQDFVIFDDDFINLSYRYMNNDICRKTNLKNISNKDAFNQMLDAYFNYMNECNISGLSFGMQMMYLSGYKPYNKRFFTNSYFRNNKCGKINWVSLIYDDLATSIKYNKSKLIFMLPQIAMECEPQYAQQKNKILQKKQDFKEEDITKRDGLNELYQNRSEYYKEFYNLIASPSSYTIKVGRESIMHQINNNLNEPKIISSKYKK